MHSQGAEQLGRLTRRIKDRQLAADFWRRVTAQYIQRQSIFLSLARSKLDREVERVSAGLQVRRQHELERFLVDVTGWHGEGRAAILRSRQFQFPIAGARDSAPAVVDGDDLFLNRL